MKTKRNIRLFNMSKRDIPFSSFQQINKNSQNRKVVLFGAGYIAGKTIRKLNDHPAFFVDNSVNMWGGVEDSIGIYAPKELLKQKVKPFIIICSTSFIEIAAQLIELGFISNDDFVVSPILNDLRVIDELENVTKKLLIASGAQYSVEDEFGGGLYEVDIKGMEFSYKKVFSGSCHSAIYIDERLFVTDDERGIIELDRNYQIVRCIEFPVLSRGHGLSYHSESESIFVACSGLDCVLRYDMAGKLVSQYDFSKKQNKASEAFHHTNDCLVVGDSLYVSMFSATGNWKRDIFDGAVVEFDIESGEKIGTVISDLWMPHNIQFLDGSLTVLDSLRGGLVRNNAQTTGQFPGFTRGLAYDGEYFFIGQSRNRNFSKNMGVSKNISIDTGIIIFDEETKVSRTITLSSKVSEVHGILILQ